LRLCLARVVGNSGGRVERLTAFDIGETLNKSSDIPQRLKPRSFHNTYGTAEAAPLQQRYLIRDSLTHYPAFALAAQLLQHIFGGFRLADSGENFLDAVTVGFGVEVGHGVDDQHDVVSVVVSTACGRFHADACGYSGEEYLSDSALAQVFVEGCADEGADALLGDEVVAGVLFEFGNELGPIGRECEVAGSAVGTPWSPGGDVDEDDGEVRSRKARASRAERATISPVGCAAGRPTIPFCRSMTMRAAVGSSVVRGMDFLLR
jgi:hypothetical protein